MFTLLFWHLNEFESSLRKAITDKIYMDIPLYSISQAH